MNESNKTNNFDSAKGYGDLSDDTAKDANIGNDKSKHENDAKNNKDEQPKQ